MLPALIGAGASLLGGLVSSNAAKKDAIRQQEFQRQQIAEMNAYNDPAQIRSRAEAAGFNPLLFIGPGVGQQSAVASAVSSGNFMGSALADAGMQIADQMSKNRELARLEKLSAENKKLAEKVQSLTIRPKVGGVYAQRDATRSVAAAVGRENVNLSQVAASASSAVGAGSVGNGTNPTPLLSDQKTTAKDTEELSGFMKIRNKFAPDGFYLPGADGEPLDIWQLPVVLGSYYVDKGMRGLDRLSSDGPYLGPDISLDRVAPLTSAQKAKLARQKATRKALRTPTFALPYYGGGF